MNRGTFIRFLNLKRFAVLATMLLAVHAPAAAVNEALYEYGMPIRAANYTGTDSLLNFPALIRLPAVFTAYSLANDGSDLRIADANGEILPVEIEEWNPKGVSLVWVRIPELTGNTKVTAYIGATNPDPVPAESVWSGYVGVYHMDETDIGAIEIADATGNANATAHAKSIVMEGVIGLARGRTDATGKNGAMMTVPASDLLNVSPSFTVSGWLYPTAKPDWSYIFARKDSDSYQSWGVQFRVNGGLTPIGIYSCGTSDNDNQRNLFSTTVLATNTWAKYDVVWQDTSVSLYLNGNLIGTTQTINPSGTVIDGELDLLCWPGLMSVSVSGITHFLLVK